MAKQFGTKVSFNDYLGDVPATSEARFVQSYERTSASECCGTERRLAFSALLSIAVFCMFPLRGKIMLIKVKGENTSYGVS